MGGARSFAACGSLAAESFAATGHFKLKLGGMFFRETIGANILGAVAGVGVGSAGRRLLRSVLEQVVQDPKPSPESEPRDGHTSQFVDPTLPKPDPLVPALVKLESG